MRRARDRPGVRDRQGLKQPDRLMGDADRDGDLFSRRPRSAVNDSESDQQRLVPFGRSRLAGRLSEERRLVRRSGNGDQSGAPRDRQRAGGVPRSAGSSIWTRLFPNDAAAGSEFRRGTDRLPPGTFSDRGDDRLRRDGGRLRAVDERLDRVVALKVLSPSLSRDQASIQRFVNEARAAARLDHDNIARVFYVGEDQGLHFIAHEFVTGRNIRDMIRDRWSALSATGRQLHAANRHRPAAHGGGWRRPSRHQALEPHRDAPRPGEAGRPGPGEESRLRIVRRPDDCRHDAGNVRLHLARTGEGPPQRRRAERHLFARLHALSHARRRAPLSRKGPSCRSCSITRPRTFPTPARRTRSCRRELSAVVRRMMAPDPRDRYATPDDLILDLLADRRRDGTARHQSGRARLDVAADGDAFVHRTQRDVDRRGGGPVDRLPCSSTDSRSARAASTRSLDNTAFNRLPQRRQHRRAAVAGRRCQAGLGDDHRGTAAGTRDESGRAPSDRPPPRRQARRQRESATARRPDRSRRPSRPTRPSISPTSRCCRHSIARAAGRAAPCAVSCRARSPKRSGRSQPQTTTAAGTSKPKPAAVPRAGNLDHRRRLTTSYATLEAAVADAKDGSSIELKYNGRRAVSEKPFRVSGQAGHDPRRKRIPSRHLLLAARAARHRFREPHDHD